MITYSILPLLKYYRLVRAACDTFRNPEFIVLAKLALLYDIVIVGHQSPIGTRHDTGKTTHAFCLVDADNPILKGKRSGDTSLDTKRFGALPAINSKGNSIMFLNLDSGIDMCILQSLDHAILATVGKSAIVLAQMTA